MISIKLLDGKTISISLPDSDSNSPPRVADLRRCHASLTNANLYANGEQLDDDQLLGSRGQDGSFLVAVPTTKRQRMQPKQRDGDQPLAGSAAPAYSGQIDTLLPGYHLRPSPMKVQPANSGPAQLSVEEAEEKEENPAASDLPRPLDRLRRLFELIISVHKLLVQHQAEPLWTSLSPMISGASVRDKFIFQDVVTLQSIVPELIVLRNASAPHSDIVSSTGSLSESISWVVDISDPKSDQSKEKVGRSTKILRCKDYFMSRAKAILVKVQETNQLDDTTSVDMEQVLVAAAHLASTRANDGSCPYGSAKPPRLPDHWQTIGDVLPTPSQMHCSSNCKMDVDEFISHLKSNQVPWVKSQIAHEEILPARRARFALASDHTPLSQSICGPNRQLYVHQAEAIKSIMQGNHTVICTSTASGKSLCYSIPILESIQSDPSSTAILIFPTKALGQDQQSSLRRMMRPRDYDTIFCLDGDTPMVERDKISSSVRVMITNPDMLSMSILPSHSRFSAFFSGLKYVVVDESHTYSGAFGCHVALVLRRLRRLCSHYGSQPTFVACSATVSNPLEHTQSLFCLSSPPHLIDMDGSQSSTKTFLLWNPQGSSIVEISLLLSECIKHGLKTIAFARSKKLCEILAGYTREILKGQSSCANLSGDQHVEVYRGGYSAMERRRIESLLFNGELKAVIATNALELGVDLPSMDVTLHLGYQGSLASMRQQAGRAGRRGDASSLAIYVAFDSPLDQHFMRSPRLFFDGHIESVSLDPNNALCLRSHLLCAAAELSLSLVDATCLDAKLFGSKSIDIAKELVSLRLLGRHPRSKNLHLGGLYYIGQIEPVARTISLRHIDEMLEIKDGNGKVLEEIELSMAPFMVYDGAVYMNNGHTFYCTKLDLVEKTATVRPCHVKYFTRLVKETCVTVQSQQQASRLVFSGPAQLRTRFEAFLRIRKGSKNEVIDKVNLYLPDLTYETYAAFIVIPPQSRRLCTDSGYDFKASCHAASHALLNVLPLFISCSHDDFGTECEISQSRFTSRLLIYDKQKGGTGISLHVATIIHRMIQQAILLLQCNCEDGCPSCILMSSCPVHDHNLSKRGATIILTFIENIIANNN